MDLELLDSRCRELREQTTNIYERLTAEQAFIRRQVVTALYTTIKVELVDKCQPSAANFLQAVMEDVNQAK